MGLPLFASTTWYKLESAGDVITQLSVVFPPDNYKLRRRAIGVICKLDRHMTCVIKHFVVTFLFAFESFATGVFRGGYSTWGGPVFCSVAGARFPACSKLPANVLFAPSSRKFS
jgi:hypothetical protein